eukprot:10137514-Lingulodinium_polyedra.AAC.1
MPPSAIAVRYRPSFSGRVVGQAQPRQGLSNAPGPPRCSRSAGVSAVFRRRRRPAAASRGSPIMGA